VARRHTLPTIALTVAAALALLSPATAAAGTPCRSLDPATTAAVDAVVEANVGPEASPGMSISISTPRGCYARSYGVRDLRTNAPLRPADHVRIASITKTFTATVILQMADRRMLRLDDRLSRYVAGVPNGDRITLRQVLAMNAGIYDYTSDAGFTADLAADPLLRFSETDFFAILHRHPPAYEPGAKTIYSDSNYYLLTLVAEKVGGRPLGDLIQRWITRPLGMRDTSYPATPDMPRPFARGYLPGTPVVEVSRIRPEISRGAGAMISTVGDMAIWARALADGTLLSPRMQAERLAIAPLTGITSPLTVGYGLGIFEIQGYIGHNGAILGYSSATFYRPDIDTAITVVGNRSDNFSTATTTVFVDVARQLNPDLFPPS
jgi:D-alanyl-D-alanine carboxypeptidase